MKQFDLISDVHLDFWIEDAEHLLKLQNRIKRFIALILPSKCSATLVIAGDLGHSNKQNYIFLKLLKEHYEHIVLVAGNHDYYLEKRAASAKSGYDSMDRLLEMKQLASRLPNVHYLDGESVELDGVVYGGCGMWYDLQYGVQVLNASLDQIFARWRAVSNDFVRIKGKPRHTLDMFKREKAKLDRVIAACDVIVTHFPPEWSRVPEAKKLDLATSFYYFDGAPYVKQMANKIWCFGHVHTRMDYVRFQCRFVNASLGYPAGGNKPPRQISQITI